jgi:MFS family permease
VVELTPEDQRGVAMALFSQCFAVSAVVAPPLAGELMRRQGHALLVWLLMAGACLAGLALVALLARQQRRQLLRVLGGQEAAGGHGVLYRLPPPQANRAAAGMADKATRANAAAATGVAATESAGAVAAMTAGVAETVETVEATTVATPASSEGGAIESRSD